MSFGARLAMVESTIPQVESRTAVYVRMDGVFALVNVGDSTIPVRCSGYTPPVEGMTVQLINQAGTWLLTGPAVPLAARGKVVGMGPPKYTVEVGAKSYPLGIAEGVVVRPGDEVTIDWVNQIIAAKPSTARPSEGTPEVKPPTAALFDVTVQAIQSGNYWRGGNLWNSTDPRGSTNNVGAWFYGSALTDSLAGSVISSAAVNLPAIRQGGTVLLGLHSYPSQPSGAPSISTATALAVATGWVNLPPGFASALQDGTALGLTVQSTNGDNIWRGVPGNPLSGAIRITGNR